MARAGQHGFVLNDKEGYCSNTSILYTPFENALNREPGWCRPYAAYSLLYSHFGEQVNNVRMVVSPCGASRATSMASSWMDNPTDKDRLLLKHQR